MKEMSNNQELIDALTTTIACLEDALEGGDYWVENATLHDLPMARKALANAVSESPQAVE